MANLTEGVVEDGPPEIVTGKKYAGVEKERGGRVGLKTGCRRSGIFVEAGRETAAQSWVIAVLDLVAHPFLPDLSAGVGVFVLQICCKPLPVCPALRTVCQVADDQEQLGLEKGFHCFMQGVIHPDASAPVLKPAVSFQVGEMAGNGRLRHIQGLHQIADAIFVATLQENEKAQSGFIGQRFENFNDSLHRGKVLQGKKTVNVSRYHLVAIRLSGYIDGVD